MSKLLNVSRSKYRVAVSDILPYERPLFFTNRFFVRFLKKYGIVCNKNRLEATKNKTDVGLDVFLSILGGNPGTRRPAFQYHIAKNSKEKGRLLTLIHPYHQVAMIEFYDRYKTVLTDFCQRSNYSIRFPHKVAVTQKKPKGFPKYISDDAEDYHSEESIKHFFAYKYYNNINEFYNDYRFLRAEKKYSLMEKTDLKQCFDSIIPESLSEAMFGLPMEKATGTVAHVFYNLNQEYENRIDGDLTGKGIVIGPEFSRIYAEIILQRIDVDCEKTLEKEGLLFNRDYVFYRYVDDGFLFYNQESVKEKFNSTYQACLKRYGLRRGDDKTLSFEQRPFLETITSGKLALSELIRHSFENRLETFQGFQKIQKGRFDTPTSLHYKSFVQSVRAIMLTYNLKYKDVMSFVLSVISNTLSDLLGEFNNLYKQYSKAAYMDDISQKGLEIKEQYERDFVSFVENLIEVLFYFFSCDPRMSTSTKVVGILNQIQLYVRGKFLFSNDEAYDKNNNSPQERKQHHLNEEWSSKFDQHIIDSVDEKITEMTKQLFVSSDIHAHGIIEILNFLELQKCMSTSVQLHPRRLSHMITKFYDELNFFSVFQALHFIKQDKRYCELKGTIMRWIQKKVSSLYGSGRHLISETEAVLTFFETLCCPWVDLDDKNKIVDGFVHLDEVSKKSLIIFATKQRDLFVKWREYSILEELQHANNTEVY